MNSHRVDINERLKWIRTATILVSVPVNGFFLTIICVETSNRSADGKRKRKSRWGGVQLQIEEISRRLRTGDLGIPVNPEERSPSPEPIYNNEGKRLNTREFRTRKKLEDERHLLVQQMIQINPGYKPPPDYKPPQQKISEKVLIPQEEYPDINFVGLLIGPRGNTLKAMEKETGAKIIIRGKGSVKEGKIGRKDGQPMPGEDEPLHAFITAGTHESVAKAVSKIREVIRQGIEVPESQNDLRRMQLRELALLNGTLRESDGPRCSNCGSTAHRSWQCPDKPNVTNNVICTNCGATGHISKDCKEKKTTTITSQSKIDEEYMSLMAELGEGPPPPSKIGSTLSSSPLSTLSGSSTPRALLPAPAQSNAVHSQPLLPTPSIVPQSQQSSAWSRSDSTQQLMQQSYWSAMQSSAYGYGATVGATSVGGDTYSGLSGDSYSQTYSQAQTSTSMPWLQQGVWSQASNGNAVAAVPPPPPPSSASTNANPWATYATISAGCQLIWEQLR
ncbi:splicing factor 1-like protein [Leptotrombidium deliense]|uniref:Branchpoint-bridging protein n=1 Tax=Leptotrombidium deliense TaxID=299467 RepID=A0A443SE49_9ACAR|nr:splicing factor 1-like protein [Leptotrombidium deliense]